MQVDWTELHHLFELSAVCVRCVLRNNSQAEGRMEERVRVRRRRVGLAGQRHCFRARQACLFAEVLLLSFTCPSSPSSPPLLSPPSFGEVGTSSPARPMVVQVRLCALERLGLCATIR